MKRRITIIAAGLVVFTGMIAVTPVVHAETKTGDISVQGIVAGPPPSTAPTIEEPAGGVTFSTKSITVKGSCQAGLVVKLYRNNFFAGSALCQSNGTYSLAIDLFVGENTLIARQFDSSGQSSPDSNVVNVFYSPPTPSPVLPDDTPSTTPSSPPSGSDTTTDTPAVAQFQLIIEYDYTLQSIYTGTPFYLPVKFAGGTGPYAVSVNWGDGSDNVFSRNDTTPFTIDHTYEKAGYYTVTIKVSDGKGEEAALQFVLLASGKPENTLINTLLFPDGSSLNLGGAIILGSGTLLFLAGALFVGYRWGVRRAKKV